MTRSNTKNNHVDPKTNETLGKNKVYGEWRDTIVKKDKNGKDVIVHDSGWNKNKILDEYGKVLAGLLANEPTFSGGILYHAIGHGDPNWDVSPPDPADSGNTTLEDEYYRKTPDSIQYLDINGDITISITNWILITTTFDYLESGADGSIREECAFCGTATSTTDSGIIYNTIRHNVIHKDSSMRLIRRMRFKFGVNA